MVALGQPTLAPHSKHTLYLDILLFTYVFIGLFQIKCRRIHLSTGTDDWWVAAGGIRLECCVVVAGWAENDESGGNAPLLWGARAFGVYGCDWCTQSGTLSLMIGPRRSGGILSERRGGSDGTTERWMPAVSATAWEWRVYAVRGVCCCWWQESGERVGERHETRVSLEYLNLYFRFLSDLVK